jgi:hypothetical protein
MVDLFYVTVECIVHEPCGLLMFGKWTMLYSEQPARLHWLAQKRLLRYQTRDSCWLYLDSHTLADWGRFIYKTVARIAGPMLCLASLDGNPGCPFQQSAVACV